MVPGTQCAAMAGFPDDRTRCANCGAALPPKAEACPVCGTPPTAPATEVPTDALLTELEALTEVVEEEAKSGERAAEAPVAVPAPAAQEEKPEEEAAKAVEGVPAETMAGIPPTPEPMAEPKAPPTEARKEPEAAPKADLSDFVRRVEETVTARTRRPVRPPQPSLAAAPLLMFGGLVFATGLFLIPAAAFVGILTASAGLALFFMGAMLRRIAPQRPAVRRRPARQ